MVFETFVLLVTVMALGYAVVARYLQNKLINRSDMESIQAESKRLNEDYKKASERKDQKKMDEVMKQQLDMLPKMNKMMFAQMKPMIIIFGIFIAFTWTAGQLDPSTKDDFTIAMSDNGTGCDTLAHDGIFSACYTPQADYGRWVFSARAFKGGSELGKNSTYFYYNAPEDNDSFLEATSGQPIAVSTDKRDYAAGETVRLYAQNANAEQVNATLDSGTAFYVDLPFKIPVINLQRIHQTNWWFVFVSLIASLGISLVLSITKKKAVKETGGKP